MSKNNSIILNKSTAPKPSIPFTILPSPFQTVIVISAAQYQQAIQKINELDNEIRNTGVNLTLIQEVSKKKKIAYSNIISELIPLYAKINRLIPLYYIVTKNNDIAARNLITMKYRIQQQIISLPDELFFLRIDELQRHKELLYQLEKYEPELEKLQNSGGYIACKLQYITRDHEGAPLSPSPSSLSSSSSSSSLSSTISSPFPTKSTLMNYQNGDGGDDNDDDDDDDDDDKTEEDYDDDDDEENINELGFITRLSPGTGALAKFLSLVGDGDSFGQLSSQVGDLFVPSELSHNHNTNHNSNDNDNILKKKDN